MPTILADTFTAALKRLTGDEQKQVKLSVYDLQTEPDRPGLKFHRIDKSKDPNFWSVRVSGGLRIIVHKTGDSVLLAYVGHHNDAYSWAERRRIETHPKTGAVQIVEVRERVEEIDAAPRQGAFHLGVPIHGSVAAAAARLPALLFDRLSRDDLLSVGVPEDWVADLKAADEDGFLALATHLPAEASEALLEYVSTGMLTKPAPVLHTVDPFAHPDARRRFRVVENTAELGAALGFPWEKWVVFLHPSQREIVERTFDGPARVVGSAGTGKTVVALHRAMRHLRQSPDCRVLLTTFSDTLAHALRAMLKALAGPEDCLLDRVTIASFRGIAQQLHELVTGRRVHLASRDFIRGVVSRARESAGIRNISQQFVLSEWSNVVDAWQIEDLNGYASVPRMGRKTRLGARQREELWPVFAAVRTAINDRRLMTPASLFAMLTAHYADKPDKPFNHIVVDEAQDLGVADLRFLAALAPQQSADPLFFAGDLGQRIFQQPFSWAACGISVRGRSFSLRVNYRTSHQIRIVADRLRPNRIDDVDGLEDDRTATVSVFNGPPPEVVIAASRDDEAEKVAAFIRASLGEGVEPAAIGIFVRSHDELTRARAAAAKAGVEATELNGRASGEPGRIVLGTIHYTKGLEFRAVAVMACDEAVIPAQSRLADVADAMELDEVYVTERQLLYVAATRARDRLMISGVSPASEFLADLSTQGTANK
jgi:hypothetical protein